MSVTGITKGVLKMLHAENVHTLHYVMYITDRSCGCMTADKLWSMPLAPTVHM